MKKYMAPEMETLSFGADEVIAGIIPSAAYNNAEYGADNW